MKKRLLSIAIITASILSFNVSCSDDFVEREFYQEVEQAPLKSLQEVQAFVKGVNFLQKSGQISLAPMLRF